jgi:3-deoxy-D-manno-octulosonate 8-phosphate phosphatase (KDO 8-P phosphatase)
MTEEPSANPRPAPSFEERCRAVELLLLDVDGVLTDGRIIYTDGGAELKEFHVRDGSGLRLWLLEGRKAAVLSGRSSPAVERRLRELGVDLVFQGASDKLFVFREVLRTTGVAPERVCFVGDDLPDVPVLRHCGLAVAVADACAEARREAHYVTTAAGGRGAVRETVELLLRAQGRWDAIVERYRTQAL